MLRIHRHMRFMLLLLLACAPRVASAQSYTISPPGYQLVTDNAGRAVSGGCVWTYTAGTTTATTTYSDNVGTPNTNPIKADTGGRFVAYLATGSSYKYVYENTPCTVSPPLHGATLKTVDNISAMPASAASVDAIGTAGESITAGQCVYLSDGSGGKTQGQWYKCDAANTYSSTSNDIGVATVNIASAGTGTIRRSGAVSGLGSYTIGAIYYVGTAGALTTTAPAANARKVGQADSATSLIVGDPPPPVVTAPFVNDFRLSLTTATCVPTGDVTAATTLYLTPCTGNRITLFDTSGNVETCTTAEISIAVPATTSQMYDIWAYDSTFGSCAVTLELLAWTNDTTRATAIAKTSGSNWRYTKSGNTSRMYVGSFRTTAVSGQTEDSLAKRYVWNYYNRKRRAMQVLDGTASWNYTTATIRQARATATNQLDTVIGVAEDPIVVTLQTVFSNTNTGVFVASGIGVGSTTTISSQGGAQTTAIANGLVLLFSTYQAYPAVGRQFYSWNEYSVATGTTTFYGQDSPTGNLGLTGWIEG